MAKPPPQPRFRYKARMRSGKLVSGVLEARDQEDARLRILGRDQEVVELMPAVLPRERPRREAGPARSRTMLTAFALLLVLAVLVFLYLDPWHLLPQLDRWRRF